MTGVSERLDAIDARKDAASPGAWDAARGANVDGTTWAATKADKAEFLTLSLNDEESHLWLVASPDVIPAVTGDGPRAKANAEFIAHAPQDITDLLDLARKQQAAIDGIFSELERRADQYRTTADGLWDLVNQRHPDRNIEDAQRYEAYAVGARATANAMRSFEVKP